MKLSLFFNLDGWPGESPVSLYRNVEEIAVCADGLGFETAWVAEHHFALYGRLPAPLLFLSRLSSMTRRIGLGTAVVEAPHYHPIRLAEDAALLDALSGGRLRLGIGSGAGNKPAEFAAFDIPIAEKRERLREMVALLDGAFTSGTLDFEGRFYRSGDGSSSLPLDPPPVQTPRQMFYIAASASTPTWAGEGNYRLLVPRVGDSETHRAWVREYRAALSRQRGYVAQLRFVYVAQTEAEAHRQTRRAFGRYARYDCGVEWDGCADTEEYASLMRRMNMVIGTPETVTAQIHRWQAETDPDELICQVYAAGIEKEDALRSLRLLNTIVLPEIAD